MKILARLENAHGRHRVEVRTNERSQLLSVPARASGLGSGVNGGELLAAALATCYCNDIYREAAKRQIEVDQVEVEVEADFGPEGNPARQVSYRAKVKARASADEIQALMVWTDQVAEIQNTLRVPTAVTLAHVEVEPI